MPEMNSASDSDLLLKVVDRFQIEHRGLLLAPDFSVPDGKWSGQTHPVTVELPDGTRFGTQAQFQLSHFNIRDPDVSIDRRWRVTVSLPDIQKDQVPVGSKVFAGTAIVTALHPKSGAQQGSDGQA
ncbi:hypothetical protein N9I65_03275 [bacterium]|nr:hypothetical protein [bacterium]